MNIVVFSQETDTLQTAQENPDTSIFKGGFSEPIDRMWERENPINAELLVWKRIDPIISFFPDIQAFLIDSLWAWMPTEKFQNIKTFKT